MNMTQFPLKPLSIKFNSYIYNISLKPIIIHSSIPNPHLEVSYIIVPGIPSVVIISPFGKHLVKHFSYSSISYFFLKYG